MNGDPEKQEANEQNSNCRTGWKDDEKRALAAVTFPLIEMQKQYGRQMDARLVMQGWEIKFAGRYTVQQILYALDQYTDKHSDFPSPSDLIAILSPEEPKISEAQFVEAQKWQVRNNNFTPYTEAADTISQYKNQQAEKRETFKGSCDRLKQIAAASVNRINQIEDGTEKGREEKMESQFNRADYYTDPRQNPKRRDLCDFLVSKGEPDYFNQTRLYSTYQLERLADSKYEYSKQKEQPHA